MNKENGDLREREEREALSFADLGLSETALLAVKEQGYETPTPIQARAIPLMLQGRDVIGQAQTGTGKTAAFGLPIVEKVDPDAKHVQALILAPTRELAVQVAGELYNFGRPKRLRALPV